jgi:hypothetical protein
VDDNRKATAQVVTDSGTWMWRVVVAVILGEAIWGLLVSITIDLILPLIWWTAGRGQPVTFLGKADHNGPGLFASVIELCLAGTVAVLLNSWLSKRANSCAKPASERIGRLVPAPTAGRNTASTTVAVVATDAAPANAPATKVNSVSPLPSPAPKPPKPEKTKSPKKVYYNIVGEPIDSDED